MPARVPVLVPGAAPVAVLRRGPPVRVEAQVPGEQVAVRQRVAQRTFAGARSPTKSVQELLLRNEIATPRNPSGVSGPATMTRSSASRTPGMQPKLFRIACRATRTTTQVSVTGLIDTAFSTLIRLRPYVANQRDKSWLLMSNRPQARKAVPAASQNTAQTRTRWVVDAPHTPRFAGSMNVTTVRLPAMIALCRSKITECGHAVVNANLLE